LLASPTLVPPPHAADCVAARGKNHIPIRLDHTVAGRGPPGFPMPVSTMAATVAATWGAPVVLADDAQNEFLIAVDKAIKTKDEALLEAVTKPKVNEGNLLKISEFSRETISGISSGNIDYSGTIIMDGITDAWERLERSIEEGDIPWEQIGGTYLIPIIIVNTGAALWPIFNSFVAEVLNPEGLQEVEEEQPPVPEMRMPPRVRPQVAAEDEYMDLRLPPKDPDLTLPPRDPEAVKEGSASSGTAANSK